LHRTNQNLQQNKRYHRDSRNVSSLVKQ